MRTREVDADMERDRGRDIDINEGSKGKSQTRNGIAKNNSKTNEVDEAEKGKGTGLQRNDGVGLSCRDSTTLG